MKINASAALRENVKARLKHRGDRAALARAMKVAESTISTWLSGRNDIELSRLGDLAAFFQTDVADLFTHRDLPRHASTRTSTLGTHQDGGNGDGAVVDALEARVEQEVAEELARQRARESINRITEQFHRAVEAELRELAGEQGAPARTPAARRGRRG